MKFIFFIRFLQARDGFERKSFKIYREAIPRKGIIWLLSVSCPIQFQYLYLFRKDISSQEVNGALAPQIEMISDKYSFNLRIVDRL